MQNSQYVLSTILLFYVPLFAWLVRSQIVALILDTGFSQKKAITQKRFKRHLKKESISTRFFLIAFLKETDQNYWKVWLGVIWWWISLAISLFEIVIALVGFIFPDIFNLRLLRITLGIPMWLFGVALAFDSFSVPTHRKDPGISTFECGAITLGALGSGIAYVILNLLNLW